MKSKDPYSKILIYRNNGQIWSFYTFENTLYYVMDVENTQNKKIKLMDNVKDYDVTMDTKDDIHLVYACMSGELSYIKYSNNNWKKSTFYKPNSKSNIDDINLLNINNSVHIFYTYKQRNHSDCIVFHLYTLDNQWQYTQLAVITLAKEVAPYFVDYDLNNDIVFLCRSRIQKQNKLYLKIFKSQICNWSSSIELKINKNNPLIKNFLIDSKGHLHFLYHGEKGVFYANHIFKHTMPIYDAIQLNNSIDIGGKIDADYQLYEMNHKIWISSKDAHAIRYYTSDDLGQNWIEKKEYTKKSIFRTKFINSVNKDLKISKPIISLGVSSDDETRPLNISHFHSYINKNVHINNCNENDVDRIIGNTSDDALPKINEELNIGNPLDISEECLEDDQNATMETYKKEPFIDRIKRWFT